MTAGSISVPRSAGRVPKVGTGGSPWRPCPPGLFLPHFPAYSLNFGRVPGKAEEPMFVYF